MPFWSEYHKKMCLAQGGIILEQTRLCYSSVWGQSGVIKSKNYPATMWQQDNGFPFCNFVRRFVTTKELCLQMPANSSIFSFTSEQLSAESSSSLLASPVGEEQRKQHFIFPSLQWILSWALLYNMHFQDNCVCRNADKLRCFFSLVNSDI